ncbi:MAG: cobyrinic acid a,c-diamide synthase, partial [Proteobacteria bacterium]
MKQTRGIVIAGLCGGSGKSVVSVGLTAAWTQNGKKIAPFKKGPDYIDAGWLTYGAGRPCYNLDPYLVSREMIISSFLQRSRGADFTLIEGNRGLYDGVTAQGGYSTADLAITVDLPLLLVVNCTKTTRTIAAMVLGCMQLDKRVDIRCVILNQVATKRQVRLISEAVEAYCGLPVVGAIPRMKEDIFPMRHLGMIPHQEYNDAQKAIHFLAKTAAEHIDINRVEHLTETIPAPDNCPRTDVTLLPISRDVRIGILQDEAFQFYYPENLAALERNGAELVPVNAIADNSLPDLDGLYIGGGFPETSAAKLAANKSFRDSIRAEIEKGLPVYAECGGLIYLGSSIIIGQDHFELTGVFPVSYTMSAKPQAHGYSIFTVDRRNPFYPQGLKVKGH